MMRRLLLRRNLFSSHIQASLRRGGSYPRELKEGPGLADFIAQSSASERLNPALGGSPVAGNYLSRASGGKQKVYLETYGCQMNVADMEIVRSVLGSHEFQVKTSPKEADIALLMTCAIREGAEQKIRERIRSLRRLRRRRKARLQVGILGCMAERLKDRLMEEEEVQLVAGPDSYRDLPRLLGQVNDGLDAVNVLLSQEETYADIPPIRRSSSEPTAFLSIMRGCDNMCTYCIVPFTRGRERSRPIDSVLDNVRQLRDEGVKEIVLLGQNVNSYRDLSESSHYGMPEASSSQTLPGFKTVYKPRIGGRRFADLLEAVSSAVPDIRIRFTSPHPKDFPPEVLRLMAERVNLCKQVHLPAQSGDDEMLERMGRGYTTALYEDLVAEVRSILGPRVSLTSDFIAGFCGESEEAHQRTLDLIRRVRYDFAYCFPYSLREKTRAHRRFVDDVPEETKKRRARELIETFREGSLSLHQELLGSTQTVLALGPSKRHPDELEGRSDGGTKVIFPNFHGYCPGQYLAVRVTDCSSQVLKGKPLGISDIAGNLLQPDQAESSLRL